MISPTIHKRNKTQSGQKAFPSSTPTHFPLLTASAEHWKRNKTSNAINTSDLKWKPATSEDDLLNEQSERH